MNQFWPMHPRGSRPQTSIPLHYMKVVVAKSAGFCMGVRRAVETTLDIVNREEQGIATFGPLIHNPQVLDLLAERGVKVLADVPPQASGTIIIRAHGVPPAQKEQLRATGATVKDATCPRVIKVQAIIRRYQRQGYETVIIGDRNHAEVEGLMGYARDMGHVVSNEEDARRLEIKDSYIVVSQTTQDEQAFDQLSRMVLERYPQGKVFNTICDSTHNRQEEVRNLCRQVQAMVVVGGRASANTQRLGEIASSLGCPVFMAETEEDLDFDRLASFDTVGVTAGASTPTWMINRVVQALEELPGGQESSVLPRFRKLVWLLLATNLYVSVAGGTLAWASGFLQGIAPRFTHFLMAAGYLFAMHNLNRYIEQRAKKFNDPGRAFFQQRYRGPLLAASVVGLGSALAAAFNLGRGPFLALAAMSTLGILYRFRFIPRPLSALIRVRRLKEIPGSKTFFVATAWAFVTVLLPAWGADAVTLLTWGTLLFIMVFMYIRSAMFDVLEVQGDRIVGKETLPVFIGEKKTLKLLRLLLGLLLGMALLFPALGLMAGAGWWLLPGILFLAAMIHAYENGALPGGLKLELGLETTLYLLAAFAWLGAVIRLP
jgi:(E)-4-hydroxy-3-methyl-but-2-enyl pyrophosphate reductase